VALRVAWSDRYLDTSRSGSKSNGSKSQPGSRWSGEQALTSGNKPFSCLSSRNTTPLLWLQNVAWTAISGRGVIFVLRLRFMLLLLLLLLLAAGGFSSLID